MFRICVCCQNNARFGAAVIKWSSDLRKVINHLSDVDIFFDIQERKDYLFGNFLLVGKQYMNNFRCTGLKSFLGRDLTKFIHLREYDKYTIQIVDTWHTTVDKYCLMGLSLFL